MRSVKWIDSTMLKLVPWTSKICNTKFKDWWQKFKVSSLYLFFQLHFRESFPPPSAVSLSLFLFELMTETKLFSELKQYQRQQSNIRLSNGSKHKMPGIYLLFIAPF